MDSHKIIENNITHLFTMSTIINKQESRGLSNTNLSSELALPKKKEDYVAKKRRCRTGTDGGHKTRSD
jgi:hypothetical protein